MTPENYQTVIQMQQDCGHLQFVLYELSVSSLCSYWEVGHSSGRVEELWLPARNVSETTSPGLVRVHFPSCAL